MRSWLALVLPVLPMLLCAPAQAQPSYRCTDGKNVYYSSQPCQGAPSNSMGSYGRSTPSYSRDSGTYVSNVPRAPDHVKYLGAECATLHDAMRTAPSRGLRQDVIGDLQREYQRKCADEDQQAQQRAQQDLLNERQERQRGRQQAQLQAEQDKADQHQCDAMRDVISVKRRREASLNPTEVAALRSLEANYNHRCLKR